MKQVDDVVVDDDDSHTRLDIDHQQMKEGLKVYDLTFHDDEHNHYKHIINKPSLIINDEYSNIQTHDNNDIKDHKFTIIKYSNDHYQIVQGYMSQQNLINKGYGNADWQRMIDNRYSSCDGFNKDSMNMFLSTLGTFVDNKTVFNTLDHYNMFGMQFEESNGNNYWPSLNYCELVDASIIGCGDRCIANAVEDYIDNYIDE